MKGTRRIRFTNCHKMYRNLRNAPGRQRISAQSAIGAVYQRFVERGSQKSPVYHKNPPSCTMPQSCIHPPKTWNNATPKPILREWKNERMKEWKSERMREWKIGTRPLTHIDKSSPTFPKANNNESIQINGMNGANGVLSHNRYDPSLDEIIQWYQ